MMTCLYGVFGNHRTCHKYGEEPNMHPHRYRFFSGAA